MFCPNCGNQVSEGQAFCSNCGTRFDNSYVNQAPQYNPPQYTPQPQSAPQKSVNLLGIIAAAAAVLVVGGIALGLLFFGGGDGNDKTADGEKEPFGDELDTITLPTEEEEAMVTVYLPTRKEKTVYGDTESVWVETYQYDEQGNLITLTQYKPDSNRNYTYTMEYDDRGRMIRRVYHGTEIYAYEYAYDSLGRQITVSDNGTENTAEYDGQGRLCYFKEGDSTNYRDYVYAADGLSCRTSEYREDGSLVEYTDIFYDDRGNIVSTWRYNYDGGLLYRTDYVFDENNLKTQTLCYAFCSADHVGTSHAYTYDQYGNLIREEFDGDYYSSDFVSIYTVEPIEVTASAAERLGQ